MGVDRSSSVRERASVSERTKAARACDNAESEECAPARRRLVTDRPFRTSVRRTSHDNQARARRAQEAGRRPEAWRKSDGARPMYSKATLRQA